MNSPFSIIPPEKPPSPAPTPGGAIGRIGLTTGPPGPPGIGIGGGTNAPPGGMGTPAPGPAACPLSNGLVKSTRIK